MVVNVILRQVTHPLRSRHASVWTLMLAAEEDAVLLREK